MAKNIQVNLTFTADTNAAKQQMAQLQQQLSNLAATPINATPGTKMAQSLQQATQKAVELKVALNNATNVDTGKLNFSKFSQELKRNKTSLQDYAMQLKKLGPEGVQAFSQLANSIRQSETPLISLQGKAAALGKTLANTARWMISSSMLQGVMSAFSGTINYAKELNESLTSIRVVTGKSADDMSRFAKEANKAAKALGATTTEYTDASLIYYQQGLSDKEVKARTETTIKLANVVGEQASTVSEWMTAIWNNFDDGSQSLEHYADVLAKLGAATASSADEIAGGIEKFAAVADTIDLSYEYAAAALATITAETRQSEDVVGTSLKTIFARIENLKLGETLEDGTTLGQYSEALAKVGVHIQDANGNLRGMDNILNDIGARWETLGKSEQVALAQSVAGIRQYNQFMALMSNWDVMEENVQMAKDANGELEHQHEIWETGLEGATKRVQANLEEIKNSLLDENDLIPLLNIADGFLTVVGDLIDSLGGLPGLLSIIASIGLKIYGPQAANMLMNMTSGIRSLYGGLTGKTEADKSQAIIDSTSAQLSMTAQTSGIGDNEMVARNELLRTEVGITTQIEDKRNELNNTAKSYLNLLQQIFEQQKLNVQEAAKAVDIAESEAMVAEEKLKGLRGKTFKTSRTVDKQGELSLVEAQEEEFNIQDSDIDELTKRGSAIGKADSFENYSYGPGESATVLKDAEDLVNSSAVDMKETPALQGLREAIGGNEKGYQDKEGDSQETKDENIQRRKGLIKLEEEEKEYQKLKAKGNKLNENEQKTLAKLEKTQKARSNAIKKNTAEVKIYQKNLAENVRTENDATDTIEKLSGGNKELKGAMEDVVASNRDFNKAQGDSNKAMNSAKTTAEGMQGILEDNASHQKTWADTFVTTMQGVASAAAGLQMIHGAVESLSSAIADGSAGFSDYLSAITSVLFALPMMVNGLKTVGDMIHFNTIKTKGLDLITKIFSKTEKKKADEAMANAGKEIAANKAEDASDMADIATDVAQQAASGPAGWVTAAISAALVATILGAFVAVKASNKKQAAEREEQQSANIEAGKKAIEVGEGWKEQSDSMDDLIENHKRLQAASANTVESQKEILEAQQAIVDQIPSLVDKYQELIDTYNTEQDKDFTSNMQNHIDNIESYSKAWEKADADRKDYYMNLIEEETNAADILANKQVSEDAWQGAKAATQKAQDTLAKQTKDEVGAKSITWHVGDKWSWGLKSKEQAQALAKALGTTTDKALFGEGVDIALDASKPEEFITQYEKLLKYEEDTRKSGDTKGNDIYREVREGLAASKEAYEELKEIYGSAQDFKIVDLLNEEGIDLSTINSYKEYAEVEKELIKLAKEKGVATEEEAKAYLKAQKTLSSYALVEQTVASFRDNKNVAAAKAIQNYASKLKTEEDLEIFLSINFDDFQTEAAFDGMMDYLRSRAKSDKLKLEFESSLDAYDDLKSNMSMEDYEKFQEALTWGEEGLLNYSQFLEMEFSSQQTYLADLTIANADKTLAELKVGLAELEAMRSKLSGKELEELEEEIEQQKIRIALINQGKREAEEAIYKETEAREKLLDSLREEIDLYFKLNNLKKQSEVLSDKIARAKENAYGKSKLELMRLEQKALENEIKLNEQTIAQTKEEQKLNKSLMTQKLNDINSLTKDITGQSLGLKIAYDQYGNVDNYTAMQRAYNQKLADVAASHGEDSIEYKKLQNAKKYFEDYVAAYQENLETTLDLAEENAEKEQAIWDSKLEGLEYELEIKTKVNDRELAALERRLKRLDDDGYDSAERVVTYQKQADEQLDIISDNKNTIRSTLQAHGASDEDIAAYMAGDASAIAKYNIGEQTMGILENSTDAIIDAYETLEDIQKNIQEEFMIGFNAFHDEISQINDDLDTQISIVDNYKNIVDLMGKEQLGLTDEDLSNIEKLNNQAVQTKVKNAKANMDLTRSTLETVRKNMETATGEELEYWQKREEELNRQLQEDTETFTSLWGEAIQTAYDTFGTETQRAIDNFSDAIAGANFDSMDELQKAYEREMELQDRYLENYKQAYELSKLNRKIEQSLDKTDNIKSQKMLRDVQKEIENIQKSGKQMTEHELNALQKKYDLRLAEIALEDAQNAKSTVRLRRDSEGNFGYVYTANQIEIDKAQQDYEDKLYALQELNDNYLEQLSEQVISNRSAMLDELRELESLYGKDSEKYKKEAAKVIEKYTDNEKFLLGEMQKVYGVNTEVREQDLANYGTYQLQHDIKSQDWVRTFNNTTLGMVTGYQSVEKFQEDLNNAIGDPKTGTGLLGAFDTAYKNLESNLKDTFDQAGVDLNTYGGVNTSVLGENGTAQQAYDSFRSYVLGAMYGQGGTKNKPTGGIAGALDGAAWQTEQLQSRADTALNGTGGLAERIKIFYNKYKTPMENAKKDAENLDTALTNLMGQYNITINVEGQEAIENLTKALEALRLEIDKNKGIIKQQEQQIKDNEKSSEKEEDNKPTTQATDYTPSTTKFTTKYYQGKRETDTGGQQVYLTDDAKGTTGGAWYDISFTDTTWDIAKNARGAYAVHMAGYEDPEKEKEETIKALKKMYPIGSVAEIVHGGKGSTLYAPFYDAQGHKYTYTAPTNNYADVEIEDYQFKDGLLYAKVKDKGTINAGFQFSAPNSNGSVMITGAGNAWVPVGYLDFNNDNKADFKDNASMGNIHERLFGKTVLTSLDTGGYTGSWGPEGRLAMLHQKEIVLNAHDTENLLTAVNIIREISSQLETNALAMRYLNNIGDITTMLNHSGDTLQQEVHITAEFPNATNHSEIEEAFGNLVNLASQYANRK